MKVPRGPDERGWTLRYLVVDTSNWIGGKSVRIAAVPALWIR